jgi:arylsulfatase A-like enzyme/predicted Zn-dependent protease
MLSARRRHRRLPGRLLAGRLLLLAWLGTVACTGPDPRTGDPAPTLAAEPPVFLVTIDTLRADHLPAYGYRSVETPALDALRRDSILFENAYSPCPLTLPAHASLLTGLLPPEHGVRNNVGYTLAPAPEHLPTLLGSRGYRRGAAVSAYVLRRETGLGALFDTYGDRIPARSAVAMGAVQRSGRETVAEALAWIEAQTQVQASPRPIFFFLHLFEPHTPYRPPEPFRSRYGDTYDGEIATADAAVGTFLEGLKRLGLYDGALILLTADHGEGLGDHGEQEHGILLYREALHVPLLVKLPGGRRAGSSVASPVGLTDIAPTVAEVVGLQVPATWSGQSLLRPSPRRQLYSETFYPRIHLGWSELKSLIDEGHHLIQGRRAELFDIVADPQEQTDILSRERRIFRAMEAVLEAYEDRFAEPSQVSEEDRARLAALGYLSTPKSSSEAARPDPRDRLATVEALGRAFQLTAEERWPEAAAALRALLAENPDLQDARLQLADVLRVQGQFGEAEAVLRSAVERFPALVGAVSFQLAENFLDQERWAEAAAQAQAGLGVNEGQARLLLARAALGEEDLSRAEEQARQALKASIPPEVPARLVLARIRLLQNQPQAALVFLEEAAQRLRLEGGGTEPWLDFLRGDALARLSRSAEAEAAFEAEIRHYPRHSQAYGQLALVLGVQRRFDEIEPLLERMVQAAPTEESYRLAAETLSRLGNEARAQSWRKRAERERARREAR